MGNYQSSPSMSFGKAIKTCFKKYANFSGRARRSEFWWFFLLCIIPSIALSCLVNWKLGQAEELERQAVEAAFSGGDTDAILAKAESVDTIFYLLAALFIIIALALLLPYLAAWARRLHDTGKSGWWLLCFILFGIGGIIPLIMAIPDGKPEPNRFGPSPKYNLDVIETPDA